MREEFQKCPVCNSADGFELSGILGKYATCPKCMSKWKLFVKNKRLTELALHELPKEGSGVYTITNTDSSLFIVLGARLPIEFWKNLRIEHKINWDLLSKNISSDVLKAVIPEKGERILHQWNGTRETREKKVVHGNTVETTKSEVGTLLLTTQRLCWLEKRVSGFWKKATSFLVIYEIPLEEIKGISGETGDSTKWGFHTKISVVDNNGENTFKLQYAFLEVFKPMVENAIGMRRKEIDAEKKKERLHVMLDFSFLKNYMEKGGLVMQVLKCPECSASIEFPRSGSQTKCPYCGRTIYAQDVFEKVKNLLE